MKKPIYIYGAGGLGREIKAMLYDSREWEIKGFYDDKVPEGSLMDGVSCLGGYAAIKEGISMVVAIGDPLVKSKLIAKLADSPSIQYPSLIHSSSQLLNSSSIKIGQGSMITAGCILTTNIDVRDHVLINLNCTIGHDTIINSFSSVMPGVNIAGNVTIGKNVMIGSGANILNGIEIGDNAVVGCGAVVTKNVRANTTVVGVPAKEMLPK
jgi:sugar O-acyltransferase (sialic acid O-acetyltransferase NeuD family)